MNKLTSLMGMGVASGRLIMVLAVATMLVGVHAGAQDRAQSQAVPPSADAPLPPKVQDPDEQIQPQVIIRQEDDRMVHEYSANGRVYMIKVIPASGPAYYLIDTSGTGEFETHDPMAPVKPAYWRLFDW